MRVHCTRVFCEGGDWLLGWEAGQPEPCSGEMLGSNGRGIFWAPGDQLKPHPEGAGVLTWAVSWLRASVWVAALSSSLQELCVT